MKTNHPEKKLQSTEERHSNPAVIWEQEMLHMLQAAAGCPPGHTNAIRRSSILRILHYLQASGLLRIHLGLIPACLLHSRESRFTRIELVAITLIELLP